MEFNETLIKTLNDEPTGYLPPEFAADLRTAASLYSKGEVDTLLDEKANQDYVDTSLANVNASIALKAPIASPTFTGTVSSPTPATGSNDSTVATTAYVVAKIAATYTAADVLAKLLTVDGAGSGLDADKLGGVASAAYALLASPAFTGNPTVPNQSAGDISTRIANTQHVTDKVDLAFAVNYTPANTLAQIKTVDGAGSGLDADLWRGLTPDDFVTTGDLTNYALLSSPAFSGTPTSPTPTAGDNTTKIATTAFVTTEVSAKANLASPTFTGTPAGPTANPGTNTTQLATTAFVAASFAPLASPALSGSPTAPTPAAGNNSTRIATTAFVAASFAPLASPALTGNPTATTQATSDNSTRIATTAYVVNKIASLNLNDASNLTTGTLPSARLNGLYEFTRFTSDGTTGEGIRLQGTAGSSFMSFYLGGVRQSYLQFTDGVATGDGFRMVNDLTDDILYLSNVNNVDALKFFDASVGIHNTVWHSGNFASGDVIAALGYTPANAARDMIAGNGLTGGGTLSADRTFTLGTPGTISNTSTNSVSTSSHTHALDQTYAAVYTGSSSTNTSYPIGTVISLTGAEVNRAASSTVDYSTGNSTDFVPSGGTSISGTWRGRGRTSSGNTLMQRTA